MNSQELKAVPIRKPICSSASNCDGNKFWIKDPRCDNSYCSVSSTVHGTCYYVSSLKYRNFFSQVKNIVSVMLIEWDKDAKQHYQA